MLRILSLLESNEIVLHLFNERSSEIYLSLFLNKDDDEYFDTIEWYQSIFTELKEHIINNEPYVINLDYRYSIVEYKNNILYITISSDNKYTMNFVHDISDIKDSIIFDLSNLIELLKI